MNELLPCPFCGGEANVIDHHNDDGSVSVGCNNDTCLGFSGLGWLYKTEAEAIAAWNTRAAYEMEGWFYLPKPKQRLFDYTTGFSFDDVSLKATGTVGVYALADAIRKWQEEELNQHIIERICEVFKPERTCDYKQAAEYWQRMYEETFAERTCQNVDDHKTVWFICSVCGYPQKLSHTRNYCPSCGCKVVSE